MAWPLSQDYNEAIQSPAANFADPDLRSGQAATNVLGLPNPFSGNFADVYEVRGPNGRWAVKCFTREVPALRERYAEISRHLRQAKLPFTVDFSYLEEGIRVAGRWHPILKMQWVEGFTLNQFVGQNLGKPAMFEALLQIWGRMAKHLRAASAAHCDLQHGNVLLVPGTSANSLAIKLIDYDGMYVPALAGTRSGEVGHPSYQHPRRLREGTYNIEVDRFPLLLIATALRALKANGKTLWDKYDNGDNLFFKEDDLRDPQQSELFRELSQLDDPATVELVAAVRKALKGGLESAPLLDGLLNEARPQRVAAAPGDDSISVELVGTPTSAPPAVDFSEINSATAPSTARPSRRIRTRRRVSPAGLVAAAVAGVALLFLMMCGGGAAAIYLATRSGPTSVALALPPRHTNPETHIASTGPTLAPTRPGGIPPGTAPTPGGANYVDPLKRANISPQALAWAGGGDPAKAAAQLVDVLGDPPVVTPDDRLLFRLPANGGEARFSPDGNILAMVSGNDVILFDAKTAKPLRTLKGHSEAVRRIAFSPAGERLVTSAANHTVKVWLTATGKDLHTLTGPKADVIPVAFSPDGSQIAGGGWVWQAKDGSEVYQLPEEETFDSVAFSPDRKWLVTGSPTAVRLWEAATGKPGPTLLRWEPTGYDAFTVAFSPNGQYLAAGGEEILVVWETGKLSNKDVKEFRRFQTPGSGAQFSPDIQFIFSCRHLNKDGAAHVIHRTEVFAQRESTLPPLPCKGEWAHFALSKDGKNIVAAGDQDREVGLYDAGSGRPLTDPARLAPVDLLAISPDHKRLAAFGRDRKLTLWDLGAETKVPAVVQGEIPELKCLTFSADGQLLAAGGVDGKVRAWSATGQELWTNDGHTGRVNSVAFSADGKSVVSAGADGAVKVWDTTGGAVRRSMKTPGPERRAVAFSPDGTTVAASGADNKLLLFDAATGDLQMTLDRGGRLGALAFSPDGKQVAGVADFSLMFLWPREAGAKPEIVGAKSGLSDLAFRSDGKILIATNDGTPFLVDATVRPLRNQALSLCPPGLRISTTAVSSDGSYLAAGGDTGPIALFHLESKAPGAPPLPPAPAPVVKKPRIRLAVPDPAALADAEKEIKETNKISYAKTTLSDRASLAQRLHVAASNEANKDKPTQRFVLLREACDLYGEGGNADAVMKTADEMATVFAVNAWVMKASGLDHASRAPGTSSVHVPVAAFALAAADDAVEADDYETAERLVKIAQTSATKAPNKNPVLIDAAKNRAKEVAALRKAFDTVQGARRKLADFPDDGDANLALGKFYALEKGDWDRGLPLLKRCSDPKLKALVDSEPSGKSDGKTMALVGDGYVAYAKSAAESAKTNLLLRAAFFYELDPFNAGNTPEFRDAMRKKVADLEKGLPAARPVILFARYGAFKSWVDVTDRFRSRLVQELPDNTNWRMPASDFGPDPAPDEAKMLVLVYRYRGCINFTNLPVGRGPAAGASSLIAFSPHRSPNGAALERPAPGQQLHILFAALCGAGTAQYCDRQIQSSVKGTAIKAIPRNIGFNQDILSQHKVFVIVLHDGARVRLSISPSDEDISIEEEPQPSAAALSPFKIDGALEGEKLKVLKKSSDFALFPQKMTEFKDGKWSGDAQLCGIPTRADEWVDLELPVDEDGVYKVIVYLTKAWDYGIVRFSLDGQPLGKPIDCFNADKVLTSGPVQLAEVEMKKGAATLRLEVIGSNGKAVGSKLMFGLDCVLLKKAP